MTEMPTLAELIGDLSAVTADAAERRSVLEHDFQAALTDWQRSADPAGRIGLGELARRTRAATDAQRPEPRPVVARRDRFARGVGDVLLRDGGPAWDELGASVGRSSDLQWVLDEHLQAAEPTTVDETAALLAIASLLVGCTDRRDLLVRVQRVERVASSAGVDVAAAFAAATSVSPEQGRQLLLDAQAMA